MKHMRTGRKRTHGTPLFYIKDTTTGLKVGRASSLIKAIKRADLIGMTAHVFKLGTCINPVHIGGYE